MSPEHKQARAREWLADPLFKEIFAGLEASAISRALYAKPDEHDKRLEALCEARAIRSLLSKLNVLKDEAKSNSDDDPA